ncbi:GerAB/ArcD/ProY family transporter [Alkaliphilus hydrothermalis]|uniref:Spore germination protein (Amino acid permease) n=1 Tax=Alkaliphilus hydrothermalis TaxID=1482730 RepID=A0ABS2NPE8_9FIRM|nr:GerAB/ArcD/ProY family transporter [Alkaliphilus hydrothermalis]MBM7614820.1 spore germination protein (amino acid permease) [Alkaliphilus hydrothermalis]
MDKGNYQKLNQYHVIFLINGGIAGLGILTLPNDLSSMGFNQWLVPLILGLVANLALFPMIKLCSNYPKNNLYEINEKLLGPLLGKIINILITGYAIIALSRVLRGYLTLIQTTLLPQKSIIGPLIILLLLSAYVVKGGIKSVARFAILGFFLTAWTIYFSQWPIINGDVRNFLPLFNFTRNDFLYAFHRGYFSMLGYEIILFYFPYIMDQKRAFKHASIGIWITMFLYWAVCASSVVYFSIWQMSHLRYPVLSLLKSIQLSFVERVENFFIALWVFLILSTACLLLWLAQKGIKSILKKPTDLSLYGVLPIIFLMIKGPIPNRYEVFLYENLTIYGGYFLNLWAIILLFLHYIKQTREGKEAA